MRLSRYKDDTLLRRLQNYDEKYYDAIMTPRQNESWGYSMRAYHANKVSNPPEWKIRDKANEVAEELTNRGVSFSARHLKINNQ